MSTPAARLSTELRQPGRPAGVQRGKACAPCPQGLSSELGAFVAGVMLSTTEQQDFTLHQIESLKAFFLSLFVCSTGLVMSPVFLLQHMRILAGGVLLTVASKTLLVPPPAPASCPASRASPGQPVPVLTPRAAGWCTCCRAWTADHTEQVCCSHVDWCAGSPQCSLHASRPHHRAVQISAVVFLFKFPARTALAVGLGMAQIGEFAFVLLSAASQLGMLPYQVYMLLMGAPRPPSLPRLLAAPASHAALHGRGCAGHGGPPATFSVPDSGWLCAGITALSLLLTPFLLQLSSRILQDGVPAGVIGTIANWVRHAGRARLHPVALLLSPASQAASPAACRWSQSAASCMPCAQVCGSTASVARQALGKLPTPAPASILSACPHTHVKALLCRGGVGSRNSAGGCPRQWSSVMYALRGGQAGRCPAERMLCGRTPSARASPA